MTKGRVVTQVFLKPDAKHWVNFLGVPRRTKTTIEGGSVVEGSRIIVERAEVQYSITQTETV